MSSQPPAYLKFVPAIFILLCSVVVYFGALLLSQGVDDISEEGPVAEVIEDAKETLADIKSAVKAVKELIEFGSDMKRWSHEQEERKPAPKRMKRPTVGQLARNPLIIVDFTAKEQSFDLNPALSKGYKGSFTIDNGQGFGDSNSSALLEVKDTGGTRNAGFITGIINFHEPMDINKMQAMEITVKGAGIKGFGFSIIKNDQNNWIGWEIRNVKASKEWTTITKPFAEFDYWSYDMGKRRYNRGAEWVYPEKIDSVRFYLQLRHLDDKKTGKLWVGSVALR